MLTARSRLRSLSGWLIVGAFLFTGCGGGTSDKVVAVSGAVTCDGKPLPAGLIVFEPDPVKGNRGPQGHAEIKNGQFDTRLSRQGVVVGPQVVRITGGDGVNPEPFTPFGNLLFDEFTVRLDVSRDQPVLRLDVPGRKTAKRP